MPDPSDPSDPSDPAAPSDPLDPIGPADTAPTPLSGPVLVVGAGLLGTSIGLALSAAGVPVWLRDAVPENVRTATGLGAGLPVPGPEAEPQLVVVAVPPDHIAEVVAEYLGRGRRVTDVGSVKVQPLRAVAELVGPAALTRYAGSHPMAGSERSGPLAGSPSLFEGRPWAVTPHPTSEPAVVALVGALVGLCAATPVRLTPWEHDQAVARTSHVPHLLAALTAARLATAAPDHLSLSGQGVRDVTRVAAGDPGLYGQIIRANREAVTAVLADVRADLDELIEAVGDACDEPLGRVLARGVAGTQAIPGKHGGPPVPTAGVFVHVPDTPGELARLLADVGASGVNLEDLHIDHDPGRPVGLVEVVVAETAAERLRDVLGDRGWATHR